MLNQAMHRLPPEVRRQAMDYIEFLMSKYGKRTKRKPPTFSWAGGIAELRETWTAVDLQHAAAEWWRTP